MEITRVQSASMVAVNEVTMSQIQDTKVDFSALLAQVVMPDEEKQEITTQKNANNKNEVNKTSGSGSEGGKEAAVSRELSVQGSYNPETVYDDYYVTAAQTFNVPVSLLKAVTKVESDFTPTAVSYCGAVGLMQLMPETARSLGVSDSYDPEQNIMGGAKYLAMNLDEFDGNVSLALAAYNAGTGAVQRAGGVPSYAQDYVDKVMGYYTS